MKRSRPRSNIQPRTVRKLWAWFIAVLAATVVAEWLIERHAYFGIDGVFGFYAWYGFLSCVGLIVVAKLLGALLKRNDNYYEH
jgi:hypothetical protein